MPGDDMPELTMEQLRQVLDKPIGTLPIRQLAAGKKDVCILFDDMSRVHLSRKSRQPKTP